MSAGGKRKQLQNAEEGVRCELWVGWAQTSVQKMRIGRTPLWRARGRSAGEEARHQVRVLSPLTRCPPSPTVSPLDRCPPSSPLLPPPLLSAVPPMPHFTRCSPSDPLFPPHPLFSP